MVRREHITPARDDLLESFGPHFDAANDEQSARPGSRPPHLLIAGGIEKRDDEPDDAVEERGEHDQRRGNNGRAERGHWSHFTSRDLASPTTNSEPVRNTTSPGGMSLMSSMASLT